MKRRQNPLTREDLAIPWGERNRRLKDFPRDDYTARIKYLRSSLHGDEFSAAQGFDLRDDLTPAQKGRITKVFERKDPATKAERQHAISKYNLREGVKGMRPFFGDTFKASEGYDLRSIDRWTPAQKAKVTEYFDVMRPRLAGDFVAKRYRRKDHIESAVIESHQEKLLKGQKAVLFSIDPGEDLDIRFSRSGKALVSRNAVGQDTLLFNKRAFMEDPSAEIERVLAETDANVFRIVTGANESLRTFTRSDLAAHIYKLIADYGEDNVMYEWEQYENWLNGIVAYHGTVAKTRPKLQRQIEKHKKLSAKKRKEHNAERATRRKAYTRRELMKGRR